MAVYLLDKSLKIEIFFDEQDSKYQDNVCISISEECPDEEKLFCSDETNIYISPEEACALAKALIAAARCSQDASG